MGLSLQANTSMSREGRRASGARMLACFHCQFGAFLPYSAYIGNVDSILTMETNVRQSQNMSSVIATQQG